MVTRARKGRILVSSTGLVGKPVNVENRNDNSMIVFNEITQEYEHVPLPEALPEIDELMDKIWQVTPVSENADAASEGLLARDDNFIYISIVAGTAGNGRWARFPIASQWSND